MMDRRDFLKSALATAGTAQSAIVLGGMRPLEQFAGPQDAIVMPGAAVLRWQEPTQLVIMNDPRWLHARDCWLSQVELVPLDRQTVVPYPAGCVATFEDWQPLRPQFHQAGPFTAMLHLSFFVAETATPPAR